MLFEVIVEINLSLTEFNMYVNLTTKTTLQRRTKNCYVQHTWRTDNVRNEPHTKIRSFDESLSYESIHEHFWVIFLLFIQNFTGIVW